MKLFATNNQVEAEGGEPQPKRSMKDIFVGNYNYKFLCMPSWNPWSKNQGARELPFYGPQDVLPVILAVVMGFQHSLSMVGSPSSSIIPQPGFSTMYFHARQHDVRTKPSHQAAESRTAGYFPPRPVEVDDTPASCLAYRHTRKYATAPIGYNSNDWRTWLYAHHTFLSPSAIIFLSGCHR